MCVFAYPTSAVCCVLLTAMSQFEEILFVVKVWLSGPIVPGDSKEGTTGRTVFFCLSERNSRI